MTRYVAWTAEWSKPAREMRIALELLQKLSGENAPDIEYVNFDANAERARSSAIRVIPTVIRMEGGEEAERLVGVSDLHELNIFINGEKQ